MSPDRTRPGRLPRTPFAPLDEVTCYHDTPAEPANVHLEVLVPGHLDEGVLRQAVTGAITAAPRASGRMAAGHALRRRYRWEFPAVPDVDPVSRATWSDEEELAAIRTRFLAVAPPLRKLAARPGAARGRAGGDLRADERPSRRPRRDVDPGAAARHRRAVPGRRWRGRPFGRGGGGVRRRQAASRAACPVKSPVPVRPLRRYPAARIAPDRKRRERRDGSGVRMLLLPAVPRPASGATVTDLLVAALIATIARWNAAHRRVPRAIAISVPVSVHVPGMPAVAGNQSRIVTVTVGPATAAGQLPALLAEVSRQLTATRQERPPGDLRRGPRRDAGLVARRAEANGHQGRAGHGGPGRVRHDHALQPRQRHPAALVGARRPGTDRVFGAGAHAAWPIALHGDRRRPAAGGLPVPVRPAG